MCVWLVYLQRPKGHDPCGLALGSAEISQEHHLNYGKDTWSKQGSGVGRVKTSKNEAPAPPQPLLFGEYFAFWTGKHSCWGGAGTFASENMFSPLVIEGIEFTTENYHFSQAK